MSEMLISDAEIAVVHANRQRHASIAGPRSGRLPSRWVASPGRERLISRDEGAAFERHTRECGGCEYCRPSRGIP